MGIEDKDDYVQLFSEYGVKEIGLIVEIKTTIDIEDDVVIKQGIVEGITIIVSDIKRYSIEIALTTYK